MIKFLSAVCMVTRLPEVNVALFALLLNFPWEIFQNPLFDRTASAPHWEIAKLCTWATGYC